MSQTQAQERDPAAQKADAVVQERVKWDWRGAIWDTFNKSPEERRFLFKLDAALLTFASLGTPNPVHPTHDKMTNAIRLFHQIPGPV